MISTRSSINSRINRLLLLLLLTGSFAFSANSPDTPVYLQGRPNPNDYTLFANGGWDGNWFIGYTNTWIKKLPAPAPGRYARAYVGVRLGRAKTLPPVGRPPEFPPVPGEIWAAVSSSANWPAATRVKVASTGDIPLEPSGEFALEQVGESQWFWAEVPLSSLNLSAPLYVAAWSPSSALVSVASSPVIAAAWGAKESDAWLVEGGKGEPPVSLNLSTAKGLSYFQPAIAVKLIPEGPAHPITLRVTSWQNGTADHPKPVLSVVAGGESIERVWLERNDPIRRGDVIKGNWIPMGRAQWKAPYVFSIDQTKLPQGKILVRVGATNSWEEKAYTPPFEIEVGVRRAK